MASYIWPPNSGGTIIGQYADFASLPVSANNGDLAETLDNPTSLYIYDVYAGMWLLVGPGGAGGGVVSLNGLTGALSLVAGTNITIVPGAGTLTINSSAGGVSAVGGFDIGAASADGAHITGSSIFFQSASITNPGMVNNAAQSFSGAKTFTGAISSSNLSGTNTGDVTLTAVGAIPNANGASLVGQALTLQPADASFPGVLLAADWSTFNNKLSGSLLSGNIFVGSAGNLAVGVVMSGDASIVASGAVSVLKANDSIFYIYDNIDATKRLMFETGGQATGVTTTLSPLATQNETYQIQPNVDPVANIITQNTTSEQIFIGANTTIGASNSGIQYSNATVANRGQIKLHSYFAGASIAGVSTLTSRSGTIGINNAVVAGQDYSKWTAQAGATTVGSAPISGTFAFTANTVNALTVTSDYHIALTNLAGVLGDRLYLDSEGVLRLPNYVAGAAVFSSTGVLSSVAPGAVGNVLTSNGTTFISSPSGSGAAPNEEQFTLSGVDITNQYVDLAFVVSGASALSNSIILYIVGGPIQQKTVDYTVSLTGGVAGVTRITFAGDLATGGAAALIAGDILVVNYEH